jgi:hypothetical protein
MEGYLSLLTYALLTLMLLCPGGQLILVHMCQLVLTVCVLM